MPDTPSARREPRLRGSFGTIDRLQTGADGGRVLKGDPFANPAQVAPPPPKGNQPSRSVHQGCAPSIVLRDHLMGFESLWVAFPAACGVTAVDEQICPQKSQRHGAALPPGVPGQVSAGGDRWVGWPGVAGRLPGARDPPSAPISRDRHGPRSCAFSGAVGANLQRDQAGDDHQEPHRAGGLPALSRREEKLWGGEFWGDGYFASTVGRLGNERTIGAYVKQQGSSYQQLHQDRQLALF